MGTSEPRPRQKRALGSFRKVSKPLMEKRRRARINLSLEQLKALLETHWSHQIRKRKLEKADILELSVKYMRSLHQAPQGPPATKSADYQAGFRSCLQGVRQFLLRSDAARALASPPRLLLHDLARALLPGGGLSTADSGHGAAAPAALPESRPVAPLGSREETSSSRRRARPLKGQPRARGAQEDSIPASGDWRQGPSGQDRLPQRSHPLWRPW